MNQTKPINQPEPVISDGNQPEIPVEIKCMKNNAPNCIETCFEIECENFKDISKRDCGLLHLPLLSGWKRDIKNLHQKPENRQVIYTAPCGRRFEKAQMDDLNDNLFLVSSKLRMENFSFDSEFLVLDPLPPAQHLAKIFEKVKKKQELLKKMKNGEKEKLTKQNQNQGMIISIKKYNHDGLKFLTPTLFANKNFRNFLRTFL